MKRGLLRGQLLDRAEDPAARLRGRRALASRPSGKRRELPRRRLLGCESDSGACLLKASASSVQQASSDVSAAAERKSQPRCRTALVRLVPSMNAVVVDAAGQTRLRTASDQSTRVPENCLLASSETVASTPARPALARLRISARRCGRFADRSKW